MAKTVGEFGKKRKKSSRTLIA